MKLPLLGGITARRFLREYWQKKPLLIRQAVPGFKGLIAPSAMFDVAMREDVEARLVRHASNGWQLSHGPFTQHTISRLPKRDWTLLIQDLNHLLPEAEQLMQRFDFLPHARVDDVMVSYAPVGGGVGPHFDSYDVFLLQGLGQRRWRISAQKDLELIPDISLKILKRFQAEDEWILEPGDMLYLPPRYAHEGVALTECMTYSIGFRAPSTQELAYAFLSHLQDTLSLEGRYEDSDLSETKHPGEISKFMVNKVSTMLKNITWKEKDIAGFLGIYLSEPKPHVFFTPPSTPLSLFRFKSASIKYGVQLALKSRMLYRKNTFYLNGESMTTSQEVSLSCLQELADKRQTFCTMKVDKETFDILWDWYCAGFIEVNTSSKSAKSPQK